jgi:hypothetical protein
MKKIVFLAVLGIAVSVWAKTDYTLIEPVKAGPQIQILIKGKEWSYYRLDNKYPLELNLEGPAKLKFHTRLNMRDYKPGKKVDYTIYTEIDGKKTHYTLSSTISKGVKFGGNVVGKIGKAQSFDLDLGSGSHSIVLSIDKKDKKEVYIRILKEGVKVKDKPNRVAMEPQKYTNKVKIVVKEQDFDYYRIGPQDSMSLKVIGPATIKVLSRLEYDLTMNGGKKYRIQVYEDGKLKNTYVMSTELSATAVYADKKASNSLARGDNFSIKVPSGTHNYNFNILDSGRSALLKFYVSTKALKNIGQ